MASRFPHSSIDSVPLVGYKAHKLSYVDDGNRPSAGRASPIGSDLPSLYFYHDLLWASCCKFYLGAIGGHYGFAHVPFFDWLREHYHLQRNHFDRVGHFIQGAAVTMVTRELLLRLTPMRIGWLLKGYVIAIGMALSMSYELFEWAVAALRLPMSVEFIGMQGDFWDAQWDMFLGLLGSLLALVSLSHYQDETLRHEFSRLRE
ncbi:DUF2238 domain-containing protein [Heliobacillus mobilis]|uniref:DUF2238 domain-containing protein n=1 Tax=Heliobacterium mobile TaxID=28064 RepID=A0A6I3SQC5_HELMO|nr:DUF2238 domain-containing protein [Heliobacterium mobile]MTV50895.1 DUF2238 domain-containing protein [Heliobacterium mobile]